MSPGSHGCATMQAKDVARQRSNGGSPWTSPRPSPSPRRHGGHGGDEGFANPPCPPCLRGQAQGEQRLRVLRVLRGSMLRTASRRPTADAWDPTAAKASAARPDSRSTHPRSRRSMRPLRRRPRSRDGAHRVPTRGTASRAPSRAPHRCPRPAARRRPRAPRGCRSMDHPCAAPALPMVRATEHRRPSRATRASRRRAGR